MDKRTDIIGKVRNYRTLVKNSNFPMQIDKVFLFGSYAKGKPRKNSDIDVALIVKSWKGDYFDVIPPIWKLTEKVDYRIEPHVIVPDEDYAGFYDEIKNTGIEIL
jgi:predicted nucleotidyltransferase